MSSGETAVDVPELPLDDVGGAGAAEQQRATGQDGALLSQVIKRLVAVLAPELIYLFGSHARGDATAESDYDLFVVVPHTVERPYILEQRARGSLGSAAPS
ncbi:MAG: nucleotidyltransferase domain-containing protein [Chloroflexota bacterium]|nr:nucleotidyltransferase domain-containing protein [Chloroflexota bacterium]